MYVLLFDIDGTLILTGGAGGAALIGAFTECFMVDDVVEISFSGRTDRGIAEELFGLHGIDNSPENWDTLSSGYLHRLPHALPKHPARILPGVQQELERLRHRPDVSVGLLTGNLRAGAQIKLDFFQLFHHFRFGGFGDLHADRDGVAREALAAATAHVDQPLDPDLIWVIGDTPLDIDCARHIGVNVAAVSTGFHDADELRAARPDRLLDSLENLQEQLGLM